MGDHVLNGGRRWRLSMTGFDSSLSGVDTLGDDGSWRHRHGTRQERPSGMKLLAWLLGWPLASWVAWVAWRGWAQGMEGMDGLSPLGEGVQIGLDSIDSWLPCTARPGRFGACSCCCQPTCFVPCTRLGFGSLDVFVGMAWRATAGRWVGGSVGSLGQRPIREDGKMPPAISRDGRGGRQGSWPRAARVLRCACWRCRRCAAAGYSCPLRTDHKSTFPVSLSFLCPFCLSLPLSPPLLFLSHPGSSVHPRPPRRNLACSVTHPIR